MTQMKDHSSGNAQVNEQLYTYAKGCPHCFMGVNAGALVCSNCKHEFEVPYQHPVIEETLSPVGKRITERIARLFAPPVPSHTWGYYQGLAAARDVVREETKALVEPARAGAQGDSPQVPSQEVMKAVDEARHALHLLLHYTVITSKPSNEEVILPERNTAISKGDNALHKLKDMLKTWRAIEDGQTGSRP